MALAIVLLLFAPLEIRFEPGGVRVGASLVTGALAGLRDAGGTSLIVSGSSVEPLQAAVAVEMAPGRVLLLPPGMRVTRVREGFVLSTHRARYIRLDASGVRLSAASPLAFRLAEAGWDFGQGRLLGGGEVRVQEQSQEDPDDNLKAMMEAARRIEDALAGRRRARPQDPPVPHPPLPPLPDSPDIVAVTEPSAVAPVAREAETARRRARPRRLFDEDPFVQTTFMDLVRPQPFLSPAGN